MQNAGLEQKFQADGACPRVVLRRELYDRFVRSIYDVQRKSGLKHLLVERKLDALEGPLEKKEAQLTEALSALNLDSMQRQL